MPANIQDLINVLAEICDDKDLKGCITSSLKGGVVTGCSAVIGGLLLGPVGLAIGGALGGGVAAASSKFQPVGTILKNMNAADKERLYKRIQHAFRDFGPQDVAALIVLILSRTSVKELAFNEVKKFLTSDLHVTLQT